MSAFAEIDDRIEKCQKILEQDPNSQIFAALAEAYRRKGDLDKAFRVCQNGLRLHPHYGSAHVVMAKINLDRGLYDWAEAEVKKALESDVKSRAIELLLAEIYIYKGEFRDAVVLLRKLHLADPNNEQIARLLTIAQKLPEEQSVILQTKEPEPFGESEAAENEALADSQRIRPEDTFSAIRPTAAGTISSGEIISRAVTIAGVEGSLFINNEGLVIEAEWAAGLDATACAAAMADIQKLLDQELVRNSFGRVKSLLIETPVTVFYVVRATDGIFLFVGNAKVNLGTLRMKVASLVDKYHPS